MNRLTSILLLLCWAVVAYAQPPQGYYAQADGTSGASLKTQMYHIITNHTALSYNDLWKAFYTTDVRADGRIWDMYSNVTNYKPGGSAQGANYKDEGDSYNREHSFPKSWFNDAKPMYTDLFHLYPTDGYVNNRRSNYPFGETNGEKYMSSGGFSKLGNSTVAGYSGIVFEPADEYKGDFARTYFYMATAYENRIAGWSSDMLSSDKYKAYKSWALNMLMRWAKEDPVSDKEIARNEAVYQLQGNRNPFIDFPGLEEYVWGDKVDTIFYVDGHQDDKGDDEGDDGDDGSGRGHRPGKDPSGITQPETTVVVGDVYAADGRIMRRSVVAGSALGTLPSGVYVIDGKKVIIAH
ncbi:MAG: endonuclease [Bacteroidales bacterium]|nr:endonuclease [Candidatus Equimonas enterica]